MKNSDVKMYCAKCEIDVTSILIFKSVIVKISYRKIICIS